MNIDVWSLPQHGSRSAHRFRLTALLFACAVSSSSPGCGSRVKDDTGTETHWLEACDTDDECGGLACLCNVCTRACSEVDVCPGVAPYCVTTTALSCEQSQQASVCYGTSENELGVERDDAGAGAKTLPVRAAVRDENESRPASTECDTFGWCWVSPAAPGERFFAFSADGDFAVGERGVVFSSSDGYLEPPSAADLSSVVVVDGQPWVAGSDGVWARGTGAWTRIRDIGASELAVDASGDVWALRSNELSRWDGQSWRAVTPETDRPEMLMLNDVFVAQDGVVSVVGGYFLDRLTIEGVMFTWNGDSWVERAVATATGELRFLDGATEPYVYSKYVRDTDPTLRLYDARDWQVIAEAGGVGNTSVFFGPNGQLWMASDDGVHSLEDADGRLAADVTCSSAVTWDVSTVLCADSSAGFTFVTAEENGEISATRGWPVLAPYDDGTFATYPTPVWAQAPEAWGPAADDVWRAPLEHYDGKTWTSLLTADDTFVARLIAGSGSEDVWFAGETELRHWDGKAVTQVELPTDGAEARLIALRVLADASVWTMFQPTEDVSTLSLAVFDDGVWTVEGRFGTAGASVYQGQILGSTIDAMWASVGSQVYQRASGVWNPLTEVDAAETIIDAVSDGEAVWLLSDNEVYRLDGSDLTLLGHRPQLLEHLALDGDAIWNFGGGLVRKLSR